MKIALRNPPCITFYTESCKNHFFFPLESVQAVKGGIKSEKMLMKKWIEAKIILYLPF